MIDEQIGLAITSANLHWDLPPNEDAPVWCIAERLNFLEFALFGSLSFAFG
jgi:hypothetical protein